MEAKKCSKCGELKSVELFSKDSGRKDGLCCYCKKCVSAYQKENKEALNEYARKYYHKNKNKILEYNAKWSDKNKERIVEYNKKSYEKNKDKRIENAKQYYRQNKEHIKIQTTERHKNNPEKERIKWQRRYARIKNAPYTLTNEQWEEIKEYFGCKCAYCERELPLEKDHVTPLVKGGGFTKDNIVCACQECNNSKFTSDFKVWYPKYKFYSKEREQKILKFLNYTKDGQVQQLKLG